MSIKDEIIDLTEELVSFRTTRDRPEEFKRCLEYIKEYFSEDIFKIREYESEGKKSLVISFEETLEPEYLLHGHIDVVEASDEDMFEPERKEEFIYGRGTGDMKAGVACLMRLMKDLAEREIKPSVALMIVSDEEVGGFDGAEYLFEEIGYKPDFAISAEPNNTEGYLDIVIKQKGILQLEISTEGKGSHGSRPWNGVNAAEKLWSKYRNEIRPLFPDNSSKTWDTTCSLGVFKAGDSVNRVPDEANMSLDIRFSENYRSEDVLEDFEKIEGIDSDIIFNAPMLDNEIGNEYIQGLRKAAEDVIGRVEVTKKEAGSDMRFLSDKGIPAVVFGPEGYNPHGPEEYADTQSFEDYFKILKKQITK